MFREVIRLEIKKNGLKVGEVAKACNMPASTLSSYINGNRGARYEQIEALMKHLNLTLAPKAGFVFHSDYAEQQAEERLAKIATKADTI